MPYCSRNQRIASGFSGSPAEQTIAELLRVALAGVGHAHHRAHRGGRREHVREPVLRQHRELLLGVEAALALEDELRRAEPPRPEQRRDPGRPGPLPHAVEQLAVAHVVAVDELLVREDVAVRVQDALGEPGGAGGVVELGRVVGGGVDGLEVRRGAGEQVVVEHDHVLDEVAVDPVGVLGVGDEHLRLRVRDPVADALVAVQHRHREQDRPRLPGAEEHGGRLGRRRQQHRDAVPALDAVVAQHVRALAPRGPAARPSSPSARCRASPPRPSRACRAGACRTRRRRCCSARGRSSGARRRPPRRCARPSSPRRRVYAREAERELR